MDFLVKISLDTDEVLNQVELEEWLMEILEEKGIRVLEVDAKRQ